MGKFRGGLGDGCNGTPRCMTGLGCGNDANAFCGGIDAICSPVTSIPGGTLANWHCDSSMVFSLCLRVVARLNDVSHSIL